MGADEIVVRLQEISTSRLVAISSLYDTDCETSKVLKLHSALKKAIEKKRKEVKVKVDVSHEEVLDMFDALEKGINYYKIKYDRRTFPKELNIYHLIADLKQLNPAQIVREVLKLSDTSMDKNNKKKKVDFDKLIENQMKLGML